MIISELQNSAVGMIAGVSFGNILNCYNTGNIIILNNSFAGGIVGRNNGVISNCYNTGHIEGSDYSHVAGITSENTKIVQNCYNLGKIEALTFNTNSGTIATYNTNTITNSYYITNSCTNAGFGIEKSESEMKSAEFITVLNDNQFKLPWIKDIEPNINKEYPILKWEAGPIFPISILQPENGSIKIYNSGNELQSGDKVIWEVELCFKATPNDKYIIETFLYDNAGKYGETQIVYDTAKVSAEFLLVQDLIRWDGSISISYGGGNGSQTNPYLINTPSELAFLAQEVNKGIIYENKYFKLTANIDLCHINWTPIGIDVKNAMTGRFDGGGHIIANIRTTALDAGLFGVISSIAKEVKNLGIIGVNILNNPI